MREQPEWEKITPEHLHSAIEHIRREFQIGHYGWSDVTQTLCLCALHPDLVSRKLLMEKPAELRQGLAAIGPQGQAQFLNLIKQGTSPSIFRAHFDLYFDILVILLRRGFGELLKIGMANWDALDSHPADWAKRHSVLMVKNLIVNAGHWIKHACDFQQLPEPDLIRDDFDEIVHWRKWRAPKLLYMQPAGNAPYDPTTAWSREDEARTNELLAARSKRFFEFLDLSLENMAGAAHVAAAQSKRYQGQVQQQRGVPPPPPQENEPPSVETIAAPPRVPNYRSSLKRSILLQFLRNPRASDLEVCDGLDEDGTVELPADWKVRADERLFSQAYKRPMTRRKVEIAISKVRVDLRNKGIIPPR